MNVPRLFAAPALLLAAQVRAADLRGVVTDPASVPLAGVVVKLASTGETTTSGPDGAWRLARTNGIHKSQRQARIQASPLVASHRRLLWAADGFRPDGGRSGWNGGGTEAPNALFAGRTEAVDVDTLCWFWRGVQYVTPVSSERTDLGRISIDTSGLGLMDLRAHGFSALGFDGLALSLANQDVQRRDSLALRFFLTGSASDMADFAARVDLAVVYGSDGLFSGTPGFPDSRIGAVRPRPSAGSCPDGSVCRWTFDLPLTGIVLEPGSRLRLSLLFDSHILSGDSISLANRPATHRPFSGTDWSFRPHVRAAPEVSYTGTPILDQATFDLHPESAPFDPYVAVMRNGKTISGKPEPAE